MLLFKGDVIARSSRRQEVHFKAGRAQAGKKSISWLFLNTNPQPHFWQKNSYVHTTIDYHHTYEREYDPPLRRRPDCLDRRLTQHHLGGRWQSWLSVSPFSGS